MGEQPHMDRRLREALAASYYQVQEPCPYLAANLCMCEQTVAEPLEEMGLVLFDMELATVYRHVRIVLLYQYLQLVNRPPVEVEKVGGEMMDKIEKMVGVLQKAGEEREVMEKVVETGVFWAAAVSNVSQ